MVICEIIFRVKRRMGRILFFEILVVPTRALLPEEKDWGVPFAIVVLMLCMMSSGLLAKHHVKKV